MRNYLFAPFEDDDHKIEEFKAVVNALNYVVDAEETHHHESALHGLRVFIGRLESYHDVIISKLQADNNSFHGQYDEIEGLKLEIKRLNDELLQDAPNFAMIEKLKAENDESMEWIEQYKLGAVNYRKEIKELKAENARLVEQVSSNRDSNSNTIQREIDDYMNHHPEHSNVRLFILPRNDFKGGYYEGNIGWDDGIE